MKNTQALLPLFNTFIKESKSGKRLKKNGEKIKEGTIKNYESVFKNVSLFIIEKKFDFRVCNANKLTHREYISEKNYWKKLSYGSVCSPTRVCTQTVF